MARPSPGAAAARRAAEGLEQAGDGLRGHAGTVVADANVDEAPAARGADGDAAAVGAGQRLGRVAPEVEEHAKDLLAVGVEDEAGVDRVLDPDPVGERQAERDGDVVDQRVQLEGHPRRFGLLGAAVAENVGAQGGRAIERAHQRRCHPLDLGILAPGQTVGNQLRGREDVAEVMVDLADGGAERGQVVLLAQRGAQPRLHVGQLALGDPDLVAARGSGDRARRILRIVAELDHALGDAPHRAHQQSVQADEDQHRGDQGDHDRQRQDAPGIVVHRGLHRSFVENRLDHHVRCGRDRAHDADRPPVPRPQRHEGVGDQRQRRRLAQIERRVHDRRHAAAEHQAARIPALDDDRIDHRPRQELLLELGADDPVRRGVERQRSEVRGIDPLLQIGQAEAGDRGHVDEDFGKHDEGDRQHEQAH